MACQGTSISLVSASPADGYRVDVHDSGPERVEVSFDAEGRDGSYVSAHCQNGQPVRDSYQSPPSGGGEYESDH